LPGTIAEHRQRGTVFATVLRSAIFRKKIGKAKLQTALSALYSGISGAGILRCKRTVIAIAVAAAVVAASFPIVVSLFLARQESLTEQTRRVTLLARDVLRRNDETTRQIVAALDQMETIGLKDPCSENNIRLMARVALASEQLHAIGFIANQQLLCSSFSKYEPGIQVGRPDYISAHGSEIRTAVKLPSEPSVGFILVTRRASGYTAIVHPSLPLDVFVDEHGIALGLIGLTSRKVIDLRGSFDPHWIDALGDRKEVAFSDGRHVVGVRRSNVGDYAAFAALSADRIQLGIPRVAAVLVPIGIIVGVVLALAVAHVARTQLALPAVLKLALRRQEFSVEYQPVVDIHTGKWVGAEALVRWRQPSGELVRPDVFIPVAEETGLIQHLTESVLDIVGADGVDLFKRHKEFHLAVNLSASDLQSDHIIRLLERLASRTGAGPGNLIVEATERGLIKGDGVSKRLQAIRASGMRVAIDDFGTGYSSLSYLRSFEFDLLKIDKSFVDTVGTHAATSPVVSHIIALAQDLNLELIAEGVEDADQLRFLREHGVRYGQGWMFAKPMALPVLLAQLTPTLAV
jgi:sensor c-di-GMP phosphodiesterase-like protein